MRCIGLIGGMSWESTAVYYRRMNEQVRDRLGGLNSADILMRSVNFDEIVTLQKAGDWAQAAQRLKAIGRDLESAGADAILICTNTMHLMADEVQSAVGVPLLHIADVTGSSIRRAGCSRPLLLATRYTMEQPFYRRRIAEMHGLDVMVPDEADRDVVHSIIFDELCQGIVRDESRRKYVEIVERCRAKGVDSVILGCTEIGLLIGQDDLTLPIFDSTLLHSDAAIDFALAEAS